VGEVTQSSHGHRGDVQVAPRPTVRAAGLLFGDAGLLLVRQRRLDRDYWLLPGGGVHFGESLTAALRRELREELCLEIEPGRPVALAEAISADMATYPKHVVHVVLAATLVDATARPRLGDDDAVLEARFFTREELGALTVTPPITPFLQSCFEALPQQMRYLGVVW
jgi:8-oxo-dGTP diphosphatase